MLRISFIENIVKGIVGANIAVKALDSMLNSEARATSLDVNPDASLVAEEVMSKGEKDLGHRYGLRVPVDYNNDSLDADVRETTITVHDLDMDGKAGPKDVLETRVQGRKFFNRVQRAYDKTVSCAAKYFRDEARRKELAEKIVEYAFREGDVGYTNTVAILEKEGEFKDHDGKIMFGKYSIHALRFNGIKALEVKFHGDSDCICITNISFSESI
ncbi:hypothetical protein ACFL6I_11335, partial [candidate division KSB1 bacterium]